MNKVIKQCFAILMITILLALMTMPFFNHNSYACSCAARMSHTEALEKGFYVFDGTVTNVKQQTIAGNQAKVNFNVHGVWKGDVEQKVTLTVYTASESCGITFQEGERYAVFAYPSKGGLSADRCGNTTLLSSDPSIIEQLGEASGKPIAIAAITEANTQSIVVTTLLIMMIVLIAFASFIMFKRLTNRARR